MGRLVFGVGTVDVDYPVKPKLELPRVEGKRKQLSLGVCPYYSMWYEMLRRSFSENYKNKHPSYAQVTCCDDWKSLKSFKAWVCNNYPSIYDVHGVRMELDKDLIGDSTLYSPNTCLLLPNKVNRFIISSDYNGELPIGVSLTSRGKSEGLSSYVCRIRHPISGKEVSTSFDNPASARKSWLKCKLSVCEDLCTYYELPDSIKEKIVAKVVQRGDTSYDF